MRKITSESVTQGHPDKMCDQIADSILDALLAQDTRARCACEVTVQPEEVHIMGEISSSADVDYESIARLCIQNIGYTNSELGFDALNCKIQCAFQMQSPDISMGIGSRPRRPFL